MKDYSRKVYSNRRKELLHSNTDVVYGKKKMFSSDSKRNLGAEVANLMQQEKTNPIATRRSAEEVVNIVFASPGIGRNHSLAPPPLASSFYFWRSSLVVVTRPGFGC